MGAMIIMFTKNYTNNIDLVVTFTFNYNICLEAISLNKAISVNLYLYTLDIILNL